MLQKIKNLLCYANADPKTYQELKSELVENNRRGLIVFSILACVAMLAMIASSYFDESLVKNRVAYIGSAALCLLIFIVVRFFSQKKPIFVSICMYSFMGLLFIFGIALGTYIEPNEVSVSFPILLFAIPLLFTDIPLRMSIAILLSILGYLFAASLTQNPVMYGYNFSNVVPYGLLSMVVSSYMMVIKVKRFILEQENRYLLESDQLTGLLNRRSYEQHLQKYRHEANNEQLLVLAMDINGLKTVNDNLGHKAGDELIRGAADCISGSFRNYGRCYRIGGDEFVALLEAPFPTIEELTRILEKRTQSWKGSLVSGVSISLGYAYGQPGATIDEMISKADADMYRNKEMYYDRNGLVRRKS